MDIDYLRKNHVSIFCGGSGIAGLSLNTHDHYHFYTSEAPRLIDDLHSHKRPYKSTVIKGTVKNHIYTIDGEDPSSDLMLLNINCAYLCGKGGCESHEVVRQNLRVKKILEHVTKEGDSYSLPHTVFHKFELVSLGPVITHIQQQPTAQQHTQIIVNESYLTGNCVAPESTDEELWDMIESCILTYGH